MDSTFPDDFQGDFSGDFQDPEYCVWGGMQPMLSEEEVDWSWWMHMDAMGEIQDSVQNMSATFSAQVPILEEFQSNLAETMIVQDHVKNAATGNMVVKEPGSAQVVPLMSSPVSVNYKRGKIVKLPKPRARCPRPGCELTFPRPYELRRHLDAVHDSKLSLPCFVHECDRTSKPYPRKDKFYEHMKKQHSGAEEFTCTFEDCTSGPWSRNELLQHFQTQHNSVKCRSEQEELSLAWLGWRQTPVSDGSLRFENHDCCPLAFLGCKFTTADKPGMREHLRSHGLIDRARGFEAIQSCDKVSREPYHYLSGLATCPVCRTQVCGPSDYLHKLAKHLELHTKEERGLYATELAEIFRPYLTNSMAWGSNPWCDPSAAFRAMIQAELEEAGVIRTIGA